MEKVLWIFNLSKSLGEFFKSCTEGKLDLTPLIPLLSESGELVEMDFLVKMTLLGRKLMKKPEIYDIYKEVVNEFYKLYSKFWFQRANTDEFWKNFVDATVKAGEFYREKYPNEEEFITKIAVLFFDSFDKEFKKAMAA